MVITFNGEKRDIGGGPVTVAALLARLDIDARRVAVELNTHVVKRPLYETAVVKEGDEVEVVNFVGGG
jgi:thiamine biosynthesis protein ThiS